MDSGVGLTSTVNLEGSVLNKNLFLTEIIDSDMEVLQSNFPISGGESWLWMQPEVRVYLARPGQQILAHSASKVSVEAYEKGVIYDIGHLEEYKKCLFGISDDAIYIRISQTPMRWPLSKIGEVRTIENSRKMQWGFQVDIAEHVASQSDAFMVFLCNDPEFGTIHGDWVKRLVAGSSDQASGQKRVMMLKLALLLKRVMLLASDQAPTQAPTPVQAPAPQTSSPAEGKSMIEELRELGELKTHGFLTEEEFNKAKARILG